MKTDTRPNIQAHFLEKGIHQILNVPELSQDLIAIFSSLEKFQREIQDCLTQEDALATLQYFLKGISVFYETAFYMVNADHLFEISLCSEPENADAIEAFLLSQIKGGSFAWALQQNRTVLVDSVKGLRGEQVLLHSMSTRSTTLGMFVGLLKEEESNARSSMMSLLSIMITGTVHVLENQILQKELKEHNRKLEHTVNERTLELRNANEALHDTNEELKRLNQKKSEFLGIAAHDLKNPLTVISGCTSLVLDALQGSEDKGASEFEDTLAMLQRVDSSSAHMVAVLEDLMNSESIESGQIMLKPKTLDLSQIAKKVLIMNQAQADAKGIELIFEADEGTTVKADPLRMHEAIDNFVSNAIKYSNMNARVWVSVKEHEDKYGQKWVRLSVKDEGPGLTEIDKSKLFGRFQKLSARPTAGESSTGLGLSIVKRLIELHYGHIGAESEHGKGSEFYFRLPYLRS